MAIPFKGFLLTTAGAGVNAATVDLLDRNTTTPVRETTTTNSDGFFTLSETTEGRYDVRITSGSDVIWRKYDTAGQMEELEVATLKIRNPADTFAYDFLPAAITAARTLTLPLLTGTATMVVTPTVEDFVLPAFSVRWSSGVAVVSGEYSLQRDADGTNQLHLNVPTGAGFEFSVNDVAELVLNATNLQPGADNGLALGLSGTAFADLFSM